MKRFSLAPDAEQDLTEIWEFIADDSVEAADRLIGDIFEAFGGLADMPGKGHRRPDLTNKPVLFWRLRSYLIVYDAATVPLRFLRVLHGARDVKKLLR